MSLDVIIHLHNEDPILAEIERMPDPSDQSVVLTNPRRRDGRSLHYLTEGAGYYAPAVGFKPTFYWTFLVRYLNYYGYPGEYVNHLDSLLFEITYEF